MPVAAPGESVLALAAIDVGSNAMRLAIAYRDPDGKPRVVEALREPVRLGGDVFATGALREETMLKAVEAFRRFRVKLDQYGIEQPLAVGTSALREARNGAALIERLREEAGIELQAIPGEEEARLVFQAVAAAVDLRDSVAMLIDIGGGSVEVMLSEGGEIVAAESFRLGTVRLLQLLADPDGGQEAFHRRIQEYVAATRRRLKQEIGGRRVDLCIGTGGNIESLATLGGDPGRLGLAELQRLTESLAAMTPEERAARYQLRPDRADVIVPAAFVLRHLALEAGVDRVLVPGVGLKDGLLLEICRRLDAPTAAAGDLARRSATALGRRFHFDEDHARCVSRHALAIFDATRDLHRRDDHDRLLLELASLLHDIGLYIDAFGHHKHSQYLISSSPFVGLTRPQRDLVAQIARYHRKSEPRPRHPSFAALSEADRLRVRQLSAILRLANALDVEHAGKVAALSIELDEGKMSLMPTGTDDLLLEAWAVRRQAGLFEATFGVAVDVVLPRAVSA